MKPFVYDLNHEQWKTWMQEHNQPEWRAGQMMDWLYVKRVDSFDEMTNLPKGLRTELDETFHFRALDVITTQESKDGTVKFLFGLYDGHAIETVIMRHNYGNSVCVTTQVGCRIGCTFCASTLGGLKRNLTAGEIVAQVMMAQKYLDRENGRVKSVVVMGSGEPFENYEATIHFIRILNSDRGLNIGQRHITVSTSGVVPNIYRFADEDWQVGLAISLHAPNQDLRSSLMPINRRFPLAELLDSCWYYLEKTGRRLTFEYALIGGKNDQNAHAHELGKLLKGMNCLVNLIPVNYVPERNYTRTPRNQIFEFKRILETYKVNTTIRREHGHDIDAACGQLRARHSNLT
ncbi:23S rRNA (adenine(2503)-C(2))-methyltransferase RlmN [Paenactinomyces guangxiensis]|uniref:Probable dual-specificity RNA methyltransferase RlmN n=1 Tax=Paenactinomyces guangxiensis TaxID=1490290 RepID=A0A7W2A915_9BACL|nr:23S rRNA (adenine(2503)-C(2))-methyltransferase RlmN [Paenactinomyces guangxiensis]MBA4494764.1 23S rRNA (adenine(2503)-C(2))-methyltransferase RlmN [Paenactinomyces guangxiensis]MBH8591848.1 23S rRNA (adenine(2503)-C(2))-methyltransferase RlmN [Paenactinomyces guangxiensis]